MKILHPLTVCLAMTLISAHASLAKEWRGVVPLHSTRADVERLLGAPTQSAPHLSYYSLPDEIAVVRFQTQPCDGDFLGLTWNVPAGTVTDIGVIPKASPRKEEFLSGGTFKTQDANAGFIYYTDHAAGFSVETLNGAVTLLEYAPMQSESGLRCPRTRDCCAHFSTRFADYQELSFDDEKAFLENYAIEMKERLSRGVIVIYGQSRGERNRLMKRAEQAKRYLVQQHRIEAQRILIADGGYRGGSATELNLHTIGGLVGRVYLFPENDPEERDKKP